MRRIGWIAALCALFASSAAVAAPRVVVSIGPVHSLVAGVMQDIARPSLLVDGGQSPHDHALRPSQAAMLQSADLIVWVGPTLEFTLAKAIGALGAQARAITLLDAPGIKRLPLRRGGAWETHDHAADHDHQKEAGHDADPHIWLDPDNAAAIVETAAAALQSLDPGNADRYRRNAERMRQRLDALSVALDAATAAIRNRPYLVLHDAFQYFERRFAMTAVGSITLSPDRKPGARRLQEMRRRAVAGNVVCVFGAPQFESGLVRTIVAGTRVRGGVLDPLGAGLPPGTDSYGRLMRNLAKALASCLSG